MIRYPESPHAYYEIGACYALSKKYETAIDYFDAALSRDPDAPAILIKKGYALYFLGKIEDAIQCFDRAYNKAVKEKDDFRSAEILNAKGLVLHKSDKYAEAIECYNAALMINIQIAGLVNKSDALVKLGRYEEAILVCDEALKINPKNKLALANKREAERALEPKVIEPFWIFLILGEILSPGLP